MLWKKLDLKLGRRDLKRSRDAMIELPGRNSLSPSSLLIPHYGAHSIQGLTIYQKDNHNLCSLICRFKSDGT